MARIRPHSQSGADSYVPSPRTPDPLHTSNPRWNIMLWDPRPSRFQLVSHIIAASGARVCRVEGFAAIRRVESRDGCPLAVVALEACPAPGEIGLEGIRSLKRKGFRVICYEEDAQSWPLSKHCEVLLVGASLCLDSARREFGQDLQRHLAQLLRVAAGGQDDEARVKHVMRELGTVGESRAILAVFQTILRVSPLSDLPILLTGETGTGKELLAHAIHQLDPKRCAGPFVALNCAAISPGLAESELFGHRRGAFTGADHDRKGLIRAAEGGVLLLDEIGELDDALQAKLLRVLQEHRVLGIGEDREVPISIRIIAATNRDLGELVQQRHFRADLFHRLNVLAIHIPPLRERPTDLKPLLEHFVHKYQDLRTDSPLVMASDFIEACTQLALPGNARQLENLVRWVLVNKSDHTPLNLRDFPVEIWEELAEQGKGPALEPAPVHGAVDGEPPCRETPYQDIRASLTTLLDRNGGNLARALEHCERLLVEVALHKAHGNQSQVARLLGITPRSVYNKMHKYQLRP
jgi:transcriptional regulator with PAS, ATPase and Fis domain